MSGKGNKEVFNRKTFGQIWNKSYFYQEGTVNFLFRFADVGVISSTG